MGLVGAAGRTERGAPVRIRELEMVAARLANGEADGWLLEINGIKFILITETRMTELLTETGQELRLQA